MADRIKPPQKAIRVRDVREISRFEYCLAKVWARPKDVRGSSETGARARVSKP